MRFSRFSFIAAGLALLLVSGMAWAAGEEEGGAADAERVTITFMRSGAPVVADPYRTHRCTRRSARRNNIDLQDRGDPQRATYNAKVQLLLGTAQLPDIMRGCGSAR